jgi:hypothetical protein
MLFEKLRDLIKSSQLRHHQHRLHRWVVVATCALFLPKR